MDLRPRHRCAFAHVGITVPDLDRAIEWYREILGLTLLLGPVELEADESPVGRQVADVFRSVDVRFRQAHLSAANGVALELFEFTQPEVSERPAEYTYWRRGYSHICLVEPDIDGLVARIRESGGKIRTNGILAVFEGEPYRFCYCEDPFGNVVELYSHSHEQTFANRQNY